jgi:hypothetical protein
VARREGGGGMTLPAPDFSPATLKSFLRLRARHMANLAFSSSRVNADRAAKVELRKLSGLTRAEFEGAWSGRLKAGRARARIWAALWVDPAEHCLLLTDDGGQEVVR